MYMDTTINGPDTVVSITYGAYEPMQRKMGNRVRTSAPAGARRSGRGSRCLHPGWGREQPPHRGHGSASPSGARDLPNHPASAARLST